MIENDGASIVLVAKHAILTEDHTALTSTKPSVLHIKCNGCSRYSYAKLFGACIMVFVLNLLSSLESHVTHTQNVNVILTFVEDTQQILRASASSLKRKLRLFRIEVSSPKSTSRRPYVPWVPCIINISLPPSSTYVRIKVRKVGKKTRVDSLVQLQ